VYLFESNWLTEAIGSFEKAAALAPDNRAYRWRLLDLNLNTSRAEKMLSELKYLSEHVRGDPQTQGWYRCYSKAYEFGGTRSRRQSAARCALPTACQLPQSNPAHEWPDQSSSQHSMRSLCA
jgi:predicted Zn-dependent protease